MEMTERLDEGLAAVSVTFFAACAFVLTVISSQFSEWANTFWREVVTAMEQEIDALQRAPESRSPAAASPPAPDAAAAAAAAPPSVLERSTETVIRAGASKPQRGGPGGPAPLLRPLLRFVEGDRDRRAEFLLFRQRFIQRANSHGGWSLPGDFKFSEYLSSAAAARLREVVSLEPAELLGLWSLAMAAFVAVESEPGAVAALSAAAGQPDRQALVLPLVFALSQALLCGWAALNVCATDWLVAQLLPVAPPAAAGAPAGAPALRPPLYVGREGAGADEDADPARRHLLRERHGRLFASPLWGAEAGPEVLQSSVKLVLFASVISLACGVPLLGGIFWRASPALAAAVFLPAAAGILTTPKVRRHQSARARGGGAGL